MSEVIISFHFFFKYFEQLKTFFLLETWSFLYLVTPFLCFDYFLAHFESPLKKSTLKVHFHFVLCSSFNCLKEHSYEHKAILDYVTYTGFTLLVLGELWARTKKIIIENLIQFGVLLKQALTCLELPISIKVKLDDLWRTWKITGNVWCFKNSKYIN